MDQKVLIFSYYFPPMGMGGTQRLAKFSKYLPEFGWTPFVITVKNVQYYAQDMSLLNDLKAVKIIRTGSLDPLRIIALLKQRKSEQTGDSASPTNSNSSWQSNKWLRRLNDFISGWLLVPDSKLLWLPFALFQAVRLIRKEKIGFLITSSPPQSIHLAGLFLKIFFKINWIADFRDEWTGGESQVNPTAFHRQLNRFLEKRVLKCADRIITICDHLSGNLYKKAGGTRSKYITLMNGYDEQDFAIKPAGKLNRKFTITHCGSLSKVSNPEPFLRVCYDLLAAHPDLRQEITVKFIGTDIFGQLQPPIEKYNLHDVVETSGYVPHQEAVRQLLRAHALLLLVIPKTSEEIITGKIFEYLASGRPVLAIVPEGELAGIIRKAAAGSILSVNDSQQIQNTILAYYQLFKKNLLNFDPHPFVATFERKNLTQKLVDILNEFDSKRRVE